MNVYQEIENLEKAKDDLVAQGAAKGNNKFSVLWWTMYKNRLAEIQARLDELYKIVTEAE